MAEPKTNELMEKIVSLCKRRGFIFQSSEIYGGINGFWDYGPLGAELKKNIRDRWWDEQMVTPPRRTVVGLEFVHHHARDGLGGLRPRGRLHRPHGGLQGLQATVPRGPDWFRGSESGRHGRFQVQYSNHFWQNVPSRPVPLEASKTGSAPLTHRLAFQPWRARLNGRRITRKSREVET